MKATPAEVRDELVKALRLDTVGPSVGDGYEKEELPQAPSRWYLTRFLVPYEAPAEQRGDEPGQEQIDVSGAAGATDDDEAPEPASARRASFPSSIGLSVLTPLSARTMTAIVEWGTTATSRRRRGTRAARVREGEKRGRPIAGSGSRDASRWS